jgi:hypothetical protein
MAGQEGHGQPQPDSEGRLDAVRAEKARRIWAALKVSDDPVPLLEKILLRHELDTLKDMESF